MPKSKSTESVSTETAASSDADVPAAPLKEEATMGKTEDSTDINPLTDFVTTSSVIDSINAALEDVMKQDGVETSDGEKKSFFELQKRMPDGSSRKATDKEMSSQDMKNKLEQAAQLTSKMNLEEKIEWAQKQRQQGNALYQEGRYKQAIDVYLTCLVVRDMTKAKVDDQEVLILPVLNNLAQCALQLGWYHKAEVFCTLALESVEEDSRGQSVVKLYFKRGKARRLRGWYDEARIDLERALEKLGVSEEGDKSPEQKAIEREFQLLHKAVAEGKKNKKRAQRAMQKVLGSSEQGSKVDAGNATSNDPAVSSQKSTPATDPSKDKEPSTPLYHEKHGRTHSIIRKRPGGPPPCERLRLPLELSYWQMYRTVLGRIAQRLLGIIGEEEGSGSGSQGGEATRNKQD